ncbi:phosphoesterase [Peptococcaceae bacterium SCADC1_2_3]|nr:phosphoesterase [Peptococcaceae bacterium SCADC1_2_3]KFI35135.1 phosphoesterase [Peptococcaceae bacterium SCADC1_2_3]KFI37690.1 phosphoesterase [Peptococcaceae bacterium SCADC1_2_3]
MNNLSEIGDLLLQGKRIILCGHVMPDGDCLGSVIALGLALEKMGKEVTLAIPDPVPEVYNFLPEVKRFQEGSKALQGEYDSFIILDCSVPDRLGPLRELLTRPIITCSIDHHVSANEFAHYNYIDPKAAAVGEIIQDLLNLINFPLTPDISICLYAAIVTDTGSFQYDNTRADTHRRAAKLIEYGVPAAEINRLIYEQKPLSSLRLLEAVLGTLSVSPCGRVSWMIVNLEMLKNKNAGKEHVDGLINYGRSVRGVEVALLFQEISKDCFKVSFRSKELVDVNSLAGKFGGGGHNRAAGCIIKGDLETIKTQVIAAALQAVNETALVCFSPDV